MNRTILLLLGVLLFLAGLGVSIAMWASGAQPWGAPLGDNFWLARTAPFTLGLGIALGYWKATGQQTGIERRGDKIRRFAASTVWLHGLAAVSVLLLIVTGGWQYLKGLLDVPSPVFMGTVYRFHYIGASLLILVTAAFVTDWLLR